jgi:hypothetical protein
MISNNDNEKNEELAAGSGLSAGLGPMVEDSSGELVFAGGELVFAGGWCDEEKNDAPDPWEVFSLQLFGREAGDWLEEWEKVKARLADRGVKLVYTATGEDVA